MIILKSSGWEDYELLDSGEQQRLESFGKYILSRPDPQAIWQKKLGKNEWLKADAIFEKGNDGKERWNNKNNVPQKWLMHYKNISFWAELSPFKHTGVFPEQVLNWEWMEEKIKDQKLTPIQSESNLKNDQELNILNLFAYTGIASLVCAAAGSKVTHVDGSKPTIGWARENQKASGLENKPIRWILDDALKFVGREVKRGVKYDGIIMDPPIYGHGPNGEKWDFMQNFPQLMQQCSLVLSKQPVFVIVNAYAISASSLMLENVLRDFLPDHGGIFESGEIALQEKNSERLLSTGIFARWSK